MFHIIRQHFFFQIFLVLVFKHPVKQKKEYNSVFKSKEDAAVGANKTCAIELTLIMTIFLVWFDWIDLKTVLWIGTPCINIIILRKKTYYIRLQHILLIIKIFGFGSGKVFPTRNWDRLQIKNRSQFQTKVKHCQPKFSLEYNTLHNIEWWEKTPVIHIVFLPPCNLCILQNYFFCPMPPCCVHF